MFNLGNFDLDIDIDDDFSSNIFPNVVNSKSKSTVEEKGNLEDIGLPNKTASKSKVNTPQNKQHREQTNSGNILSWNNASPQLMKESKENVLKRPCVQYEKPQKKRLSNEGLLQRKFPGPAGLLPDKPFREISGVSFQVEKPGNEKEDERDPEKPIVYSQRSGSVFEESSYQKLLSDFNLNEAENPLNKYTVVWLKKTALSKGLQGRKIPFLGLVVHSVRHTMPDPVIVLRDPTGEIHGSLHREVWADMGGKLKAGIALALRQVGVLITGVIRRQIYLNITMNNILAVYSESENSGHVEVTTVNKVCKADLVRSTEQWVSRPLTDENTKVPSNSALFVTVDDVNPPFRNNEKITHLENKFVGRSNARKTEEPKGRKTEEVLANLGIVLSDCDFNEEMAVAEAAPTVSPPKAPPSQTLSQAESLIFEEVLSGINLDEFET